MTGYSGKQPAQILALAEELDATVFDIRFSPRSRNPHWRQANLVEMFGDRYYHSAGFGNRNYRGGPVDLVNYEAGRDAIEAQGEAGRSAVILICVCKNALTCHRFTIGELLRADGFEVEEYRPLRTVQGEFGWGML